MMNATLTMINAGFISQCHAAVVATYLARFMFGSLPRWEAPVFRRLVNELARLRFDSLPNELVGRSVLTAPPGSSGVWVLGGGLRTARLTHHRFTRAGVK